MNIIKYKDRICDCDFDITISKNGYDLDILAECVIYSRAMQSEAHITYKQKMKSIYNEDLESSKFKAKINKLVYSNVKHELECFDIDTKAKDRYE